MFRSNLRRSRGAVLAVSLGAATVTAAGAATLHRMTVPATGSNGAATTLQTSPSASAVQGEVAQSANTTIPIPFGVLGEYDASGGKFGIGVLGISTTGYGVAAQSLNGQPSMLALAGNNGVGLEASTPTSSGAPAILAIGHTTGDAGFFLASGGDGVLADTTSTNASAVYANNATTQIPNGLASADAVYATGGAAPGIFATSTSEAPIAAEKNCNTTTTYVNENSAQVCAGIFLQDNGTQGYELEIYNSVNNNYPLFSDSSGNLFLTGAIYATNAALTRTNPKNDVLTYAAQQTQATVEDIGSAQLSGGYARVALAADFRQTIDAGAPYAVFLTPYGDNHGLYIASRTADGFVVREAQGGHSSMPFDYRIVATPYGKRNAARLPHETARESLMPPSQPDFARARHAAQRAAEQFTRPRYVAPPIPASLSSLTAR